MIQSPKFDDSCQPIMNMINGEHELNFTINNPPFIKIDKEDFVRLTVYDDSSIVPCYNSTFIK